VLGERFSFGSTLDPLLVHWIVRSKIKVFVEVHIFIISAATAVSSSYWEFVAGCCRLFVANETCTVKRDTQYASHSMFVICQQILA
jgi:hypothetical protein